MAKDQTLVRDVMTTQLVTVGMDDDAGHALQLMSDHNIHRLPVVRSTGGEVVLIGIVTDRDLRLAADSPYLGSDPSDIVEHLGQLAVRDIMTNDMAVVGPGSTVALAAEVMLERHVGGLPVVERAGELYLVGLVTRSDLLGHLIRLETDDG